jgi:hypothetical protein
MESSTINFRMMKINFQTLNKNDRIILSSINSLSDKINTQQFSVNHLAECVNDVPNVIKFIFEKTIINFINKQKDDNSL